MHISRAVIVVMLCLTSGLAYSQFTQVSGTPIVTDGRESAGVAWVDYDNDGDDDLFVTVSLALGSPTPILSDLLYRNNGDGTFTRIMTGDPVNDNGIGRNSTWGDYDNDGFIDLFVVDQMQSTLYKNSAGGFIKIPTIPTNTFSFSAGVDLSGAAWGDYDGDGFLDLYLTAYQLSPAARNFLYKNNGNGTFSQIPETSPVTTMGFSMDPSLIDYNGDGMLDLVVPNYSGPSVFLYANQGSGNFSNVALAAGLFISLAEYVTWADYDNDGDFDAFFNVNYNASNQLFENNGDGTFSIKPVGPSTQLLSAAAAWGDFDNDGFIDLIQVGAYTFPGGSGTEGKTLLFKNNGDKTFTNVSDAQGMMSGYYSWAVAWSDYNKDGFLDVIVGNKSGNNHPPNNVLYKNTPNSNNWINIKLIGKNSNRSAIGANVRIKAGGLLQSRTVQSKTGGNSQNSLNVHFGIGKASKIDTMQVEWPLKGYQELVSQDPNRFIEITEIDFPPAPTNLAVSNIARDVTLEWKDNSVNETGFRIERAKGKPTDFKYIGTVPANSTSFKDVGVAGGNYYYRVAASITGGFSTYTPVSRAVVITGIEKESATNLNVYPNPVTSDFHLQQTGRSLPAAATLTNIYGQTIATYAIDQEDTLISMEGLSAGLYVLKVNDVHVRILKK